MVKNISRANCHSCGEYSGVIPFEDLNTPAQTLKRGIHATDDPKRAFGALQTTTNGPLALIASKTDSKKVPEGTDEPFSPKIYRHSSFSRILKFWSMRRRNLE